MSKYIRLKKFTPKLLFVYVVAVVLIGYADPHPAQPYFIGGIVLMMLGELVRVWAAGHLEKNELVTITGPYAFVKNPLYIGSILITVGFCIIAKADASSGIIMGNLNWILLGICVLAFLFYYVPYKKNREGNRLEDKFGDEWVKYDEAVPDYIPRLTPYKKSRESTKQWRFDIFLENSEHWTFAAIIALILLVAFNRQLIDLVQSIWN